VNDRQACEAFLDQIKPPHYTNVTTFERNRPWWSVIHSHHYYRQKSGQPAQGSDDRSAQQ
jgi:hypothetical protein